ncbi:MAG: PQQ-binding-like beta-propeller repeat protein [Anaerolineae bacterium]|nr:PQQ-binding-like beta-propeller repeat protein [Anaerolineae bacterium]
MNLRTVFGIGLIVAALVAAAAAFALPWAPLPKASVPMLERYAPLGDGDAFFLLGRDGSGQPLDWTSRTIEILPTSRALAGEVSSETRGAIQKFMRQEGEEEIDLDTLAARLDRVVIYRETDRALQVDGQLLEIVTIGIRDERGETVISSWFPQDRVEIVFDPPVLILPATFEVGKQWQGDGMAGSMRYVWKMRVAERNAAADCWTIETEIQEPGPSRRETDYCGGKGMVATRSFDAGGTLIGQTEVYFRDEPLASGALDAFPPEPAASRAALDPQFENWTLTRLGRVGKNIGAGEGTIPPTWLPTNPPSVLASGYLGAFFAYDADEPAATALWSFPVKGTVYSQPVLDAATGRIYFGASDKRLYALDARGIFLWSFRAHDNIAARPLLTDKRVIFGSEDRHVYAVNAESGALDWSVELASPIVSGAAFANGNVIVGSDDGTVYALDETGSQTRWTFDADDAVQAPIIVADDTVYVASRGGTLFALDAANGAERWRADAGAALDYAPLLADGRVYVVGSDGNLSAFDAATGDELWKTHNSSFSGTPLMVNDALIVAGTGGKVSRLDRDGKVVQTWTGADVSNAPAVFRQSPAMGNDAIWLVDDRAGLWRLGRPRAKIATLNPVWTASVGEPPFQQYSLTTSAVEYGERAVVLDEGAHVYVVDPQNGAVERVGQILPEGSNASRLDSVVAGDTLFTIIGTTLVATNLVGGSQAWLGEGTTPSYRPVTVAENTVLWTQLEFDQTGAGVAKGTVTALDRSTGEVRWQNEMQGRGFPSGVTVRDGTVYTAEPAAYDLATGAQKWRAAFDGWTAGEPVTSADGQVLYVPASRAEKGLVLALDTSDGEVLWQKPTTTNTPSFVDKAHRVGDAVIVAGLDGTVAALNAADGGLRWSLKPPAPKLGTLNAQDGQVWMMLQDGRVIAVSAETGEITAQFSDVAITLSGVTQHPIVVGETVIVPYGTILMGLREAP